jgi:hypothetical protein
LAEGKESEQNQPKRSGALENVLATALTFALSYVAARGIPSSNQSGDQINTNQQIADWTAALAKYTKKLAHWTLGLVFVGDQIVIGVSASLRECPWSRYGPDQATRSDVDPRLLSSIH